MKGFLYYSAYNNIVETVHMDAAPGRIMNGDANSCGNSLAAASRDSKATPALFMIAARQFLATAGARTCAVSCYDPTWSDDELGFETRRFDDCLYVTGVTGETRLARGMHIVAAGENAIPFLLKDVGCDIFDGRGTDREDWDLAMRMFDDIDVFPGDDRVERLDLRRYPRQTPDPVFGVSQPAPSTAVLTVGAMDAGSIDDAIAKGIDLIAGSDKLIVDLRRCEGDGDPASWLALLPYLCDGDAAARDIMGDTTYFTIYSKHNAERLIDMIEAARKDADEDDDAIADELEADIRDKATKVLAAKRATLDLQERRAVSEVPESVPSPFTTETVHVPADAPGKVILLVDTTTGLGAERLAEAVMGMQKVSLVGRSTPGAIDYANYLAIDYEDILARFVYPISRSSKSHEGRGYAKTGLPLDVHVPFDPRECTEDIIMEKALEL